MFAARLLAIALFSGLATGCASVAPPVVAPLPLASAPAPVAGYDWFYHVEAGEARLAYGLEASDDLRLGLTCAEGAGKLELSATGPTGAREIHLESGGETERFPASAEPSQLHDGAFLTAEAPTATPVFQRFRRVGWLALWQDGKRDAFAPHPASAGEIERFFSFCG